jgi:hypothetical protein
MQAGQCLQDKECDCAAKSKELAGQEERAAEVADQWPAFSLL